MKSPAAQIGEQTRVSTGASPTMLNSGIWRYESSIFKKNIIMCKSSLFSLVIMNYPFFLKGLVSSCVVPEPKR